MSLLWLPKATVAGGGGGGGSVVYVQSNGGQSNGPITLTSVTAGNCLVAAVIGDGNMSSTSLPAGWTKLTSVPSAYPYVRWWVYPNHPGGSVSATITSGPGDRGWSIHEYSGVDTSTPVYDHDVNSGTGTSWTAPTLDVLEGGAYIVGVAMLANSFTITVTSGGLTKRTDLDGHSHMTADLDEIGATGTQSAGGAANSSSSEWSVAAVSLRPA